MLSVAEARRLVLEHSASKPPIRVSLADCLGFVLAEDVPADADSPPFDKAMVDGYAVRAADLPGGCAELEVLEEITAGRTATRPVVAGGCCRIMTGAPLPEGADAVVMHERTTLIPSPGGLGRVQINDERLRAGQNILRRAASFHAGQTVLRAGRMLRPLEIGLLAEVGHAVVNVLEPATVAVLSTGDELVTPDQAPRLGQIRNSNGPMLCAWVRRVGGRPVDLGIAPDVPEVLRARLAAGLKCDVLLVSGGVSAGVLDLVPGLLRELGVTEVFHKIRLKPGKPLWFGVRERSGAAGTSTLVFGLPGNPVSSLVCCELFVRSALGRLAGRDAGDLLLRPAQLTAEFTHRGDRPTYHPARLDCAGTAAARVTPLVWAGSADLYGLSDANSLAVFAAGDRTYAGGETIDVLPLDF